MYCRPLQLYIIIITLSLLTVCAAADNKAQEKLPTQTITIINNNGDEVEILAELADSESERAKGLMFRKNLAGGEGMLFVYDKDQIMSFWMKNTILPLSIAFITRDGLITEIFDMKPESIAPVRSTRSVRYALEVPQGWFARQNIGAGSQVKLSNE